MKPENIVRRILSGDTTRAALILAVPNSPLISAAVEAVAAEGILVASPAYLQRNGTPEDADALRRHRLLGKLHGNDLLEWSAILGRPAGEACETVAFRSDDFEALNGAALSAMGIARLPSWVAGPSVQTGDLVRLPLAGERWNDNPSGIYLLRALQVPSARIKAFSDALKAFIGTPPRWD